jgi:sugar O-acyltransferase (sialic acid O-acetyltransferase NeuD family)
MSDDVVIFGTGDFAQLASVYLDRDSAWKVAAFTVHHQYVRAEELLGRPVVEFESLERHYPPDRYRMLVAVGFTRVNAGRAELYRACKVRGYDLISYVSSDAMVLGEISLGDNCFVFEGNVIQPFVRIGNDVVIWSGNHIGHHSTIEDHCFIASHAVIAGRVRIGAYSFVGINATIRDGVTVAARCVIGAGALILHDTEEAGVFAGTATPRAAKRSDEIAL